MRFKIGSLDISFRLEPAAQDTDHLGSMAPHQKGPTGFYVYGHYDQQGNLFYVGKGNGKRAWSTDRHPIWIRYVEKHLNNQYTVRIIADGMKEDEAETKEWSLISQHGATLVNWVNFGRQTDFKLLEQFHILCNANKKLIQETKTLEATQPEVAIERYLLAIEKIGEYAFMTYELGLIGQLCKEEAEEQGYRGEMEALDRLTLCLCKQGRALEAQENANNYFARYKKDLLLNGSKKINKRIEKAIAKKR